MSVRCFDLVMNINWLASGSFGIIKLELLENKDDAIDLFLSILVSLGNAILYEPLDKI